MKSISQLTRKLKNSETLGADNVIVNRIVMDSREVQPGDLYVAIKGASTDGHYYIEKAIEAGAIAILCEKGKSTQNGEATFIYAENSAEALGVIASEFYDNPSEALKVIGITGTNGKTTIATLLFELFSQAGYNCGLISTIKYVVGSTKINATHTTPDALTIQRLLKQMSDTGCEYCFMEVSSHAASQHRISGINFTGGVFTNLSHDHLDYHQTFEAYLKAKQSFFDNLPSHAFALTTSDDKNGRVMTQHTKASIATYSISGAADYRCKIIENNISGLCLHINSKVVWLLLTGTYNAKNICAVFGTAMLLGLTEEEALSILSSLKPVEGRFQQIFGDEGITCIVDYAHTPDALKNVLETIHEVNINSGKIITVVGAGGNRDPFKRPEMGRVSASLSDRVIFTNDNPRFEDPDLILNQLKEGVKLSEQLKIVTIADRKEAIRAAIMMAEPNDIVLVAGKGHEKYQEIEGKKHPFDDAAIIREVIINQKKAKK